MPAMEEKYGPFARMIQDCIGDEWRGDYASVDVRVENPPDPRGATVIIITGSAANVPHREPWMLRTEGWLRDVVPSGIPVFGICFGHQILAQALGGEVVRNPRGREIGTMRIEKLVDDVIFEGLPSSFEANVTHIDTVARLPPGAVGLARSPLEDYQAIRFSRTCYGVQFHPELTADIMRGYVTARREILLGENFDVDALLANITEAEAGRRTLHNFMRSIVPLGAAR